VLYLALNLIYLSDNGRQFQVTALAEVSGLKKVKSTSVSVTHMLKENPTLSTQL
jgi:hypothetical protein